METRDHYVLTSAARDVATKMHSTRIRAISQSHDCRLRVTSTVTYAIDCQDPTWILAEAIVMPHGITVAANARPDFHPLGNVSPTATFTLTNRKGHQRKVVVNNGGRIRIQ
jgi:hypothetical protein